MRTLFMQWVCTSVPELGSGQYLLWELYYSITEYVSHVYAVCRHYYEGL